MDYIQFLKSKIEVAPVSGFTVSEAEINPVLKPHQRDAVRWAVHGGRRALFESFGLGKTVQQLEYCRLVTEKQGGKALIVCPLGVKQEFQQDAKNLLEWDKPPQYVRTMEEVRNAETDIVLTNYERVRDGDIDPQYFTATSLDEASVLRSFGSKTYQTFLDKFKGVKYKLVSTATPSPNKYKELIHYAGYLEVMDTGQALTRFFKRDSTKANNLTLYQHREREFWVWLSTWALFITKPSDLGYDDTGYDLPPLDVRLHKLSPSGGVLFLKGDDIDLLKLVPITLRQANAFVQAYHRHHKPSVGHKFSIGISDGEKLVGVAICGRPVSRRLDDGLTLEVNRVCTDGTKNACSMLYGASCRAAKAMGYRRVITYILESEPGTSLKAAGFHCEGRAGGLEWNGSRKPKDVDQYPHEMKTRWSKEMEVATNAGKTGEVASI